MEADSKKQIDSRVTETSLEVSGTVVFQVLWFTLVVAVILL